MAFVLLKSCLSHQNARPLRSVLCSIVQRPLGAEQVDKPEPVL